MAEDTAGGGRRVTGGERARPLRVALVTGTCGPDGGIDGYTDVLADHVCRLGVDVRRLRVSGSTAARLRAVREADADINHVQFPTHAFGFGWRQYSLARQLRPVVTLHEASEMGPWPAAFARVAPLTLAAKAVVVTQDYERSWVSRWLPWTRGKLTVSPVGNNIGIARAAPRDPSRVVTFGLLRPWRGMEQVPEFGERARAQGYAWDVRVVGAFQDEYRAFGERLRTAGERAGVTFTGRLAEAEVASELASAAVGYFPFPSGACERHTSLLAALANGLPVVAKVGERTTPALRGCIVPAQTPAEAVTAVARLMADPVERERLSAAGRAYAAQLSWERIAQQHVALYERIAGADGRG